MATLALDFPAGGVPATLTLTALTPSVDGFDVPAAFDGPDADGVFSLDIDGADGAFSYVAAPTWSNGSPAVPFAGQWSATDDTVPADPYGYTSVADVRQFMGRTNADSAARTEGNNNAGLPTPEYAAYEQAMKFAGSKINSVAASVGIVGLVLPLASTNDHVADDLNRMATLGTAWWLHRKRPAEEKSKNVYDPDWANELAELKATLERLKKGYIENPGFETSGTVTSLNTVTVVDAVYPTVDKDGRPVTASNDPYYRPYWDANGRRTRW